MKKLLSTMMLALLVMGVYAQGNGQPQRFSPEQFQADLEAFITKEAGLSQQEAEAFFPIYKEMQDKQRELFDKQRELAKVKPSDEQGCRKAISESDEIDLELKRIQKTYHLRFLNHMSASKLYDVLQAEMRFHRRMMRNWNRGFSQQQGMWPHQQHNGWPNQRNSWPNQHNNNWQRQQKQN